MIRFWNRLMGMSGTRLPKIIFEWDSVCKGNTWTSYIKGILNEIDQGEIFTQRGQANINHCWSMFHEIECKKWSDEIQNKPKLRTYTKFKSSYEVEPYILSFMNNKQRSFVAQLRCGILPTHSPWQASG